MAGIGSAGGAVVGMAVGAILLVMLADVFPRFVIGLLGLILAGLILAHSSSYVPVLQKITGQNSSGGTGNSH